MLAAGASVQLPTHTLWVGIIPVLGRMTNLLRVLLAVLVFAPDFAAFSYGHFMLSDWISWLPGFSESRPVNLALLLLSPLVVNLLGAVVFAPPILWIYGRSAVWIALIISLSTAAWQFSLMGPISGLPFVRATWLVEFICLGAFLPLGVIALRRLRPNNSSKPMPLRGTA